MVGFLIIMKQGGWSIKAKSGVLPWAGGCKREARVKMLGKEQNQVALLRLRTSLLKKLTD